MRAETAEVDILVNNAALGERKPWLEVTLEEWRAILTLNLEAPFALSQLFVPPMVARKWGRLINISSIYGLIAGDPSLYGKWGVDLASYVASKYGLIGPTKHLAVMLGGIGVTVNALCPGMFPNTEQNAANASGLVAGLEARTPVKRVGIGRRSACGDRVPGFTRLFVLYGTIADRRWRLDHLVGAAARQPHTHAGRSSDVAQMRYLV